jgi:hypothetical protein
MHAAMSTRLVLLSTLLLASTAYADDPVPAFQTVGKKDDVKEVKDVTWVAKGEAGLVQTTGNSRNTTITVGANALRKDKDNKLELTLALTYARATTRIANDANGDGMIDANELTTQTVTSAENALAKLRYDRYLTGSDALYVTGIAGLDKPAGVNFAGGGQVGYSRSLYADRCRQLLGELGYDLTYIKLAAGTSSTIHSGRAFAGYKQKLAEKASVEASAEALFNLNSVTFGMRTANAFGDTRVIGHVGVTAGLSAKVSLNASFDVRYTNFPAPVPKIGNLPFAPGFEPLAEETDTITKVSLIVSFL